jgi:acetylornithine deacetylase
MSDDPIALLRQLVAINSVNPDLVPGGAGEGEIADFCSQWFAARGFEVHRLERTKGRPSIVGVARGAGGGRSLMFNGHYDTVTLAGYDGDPLDPVVRDGKLFGRGAFDMKSGVAAMMTAAAEVRRRGHAGDILVACVADEEYASIGTQEVAERFKADAAIITEPSHHQMTIAHKGFIWFDVILHGKAAHGSRPELGVDAITKAGKLLYALELHDQRMRSEPRHPLLGSGSVHASLISGGEELSSYPARCHVRFERRTIPGETADTVTEEMNRIFVGIRARDPAFAPELIIGLERAPFEVGEDEPIVRALDRHATAALGRKPARRGEPFWTDCAILQQAGIPCLMFGADGGGAHAATEWTTLESVRKLSDILAATAAEWCN